MLDTVHIIRLLSRLYVVSNIRKMIASLPTSVINPNTLEPDYKERQVTEFFSVAGRFHLLQVLEIWIFGTVNIFPLKQVSVMPKFRLTF